MTRRVYIPFEGSLLVKRSSAGLGMFAGEYIAKNTCIIEYVGKQISEAEAYTSKSKYLFEITKKKTLDGKPKWNKAGYINHSCKPNAESAIHKGKVFIFSTKTIREGDEITYDYGKEYILEHCSPCRCAHCMPLLQSGKKAPVKA